MNIQSLDDSRVLTLERVTEALQAIDPSLIALPIQILQNGCDSIVADIGDTFIAKFPRNGLAVDGLRKEARVLSHLQGRLPVRIPEMTLFEGEIFFSLHRKIQGKNLSSADYHALASTERDKLAEAIASCALVLHSIDPLEASAVFGVSTIANYVSNEDMAAALRNRFDQVSWLTITGLLSERPPYPANHGDCFFGHFDIHGENIVLNSSNTLVGIFDFADAGLGDYHQEIHAPSWIERDLSVRMARYYTAMSRRSIDQRRVDLYTLLCRLSDYAEMVLKSSSKRGLDYCHQNVLEWLPFLR